MIGPNPGIDEAVGAALEVAATAVQLGLVWLLHDARRSRWGPTAAAVALSVGIVALATTGAGFNPVRGLAPDVLADLDPAAWIFVVGPLVGAVVAGLAVWPGAPVTGELRHDPTIPCYLGCALSHPTTSAVYSDAHADRGSPETE